MALNSLRPSMGPAGRASRWGAPAWVTPLYVAGLVLIYVGERVLSGLEKGAGIVTGLGLAIVLATTALRFLPRYRGRGEPAHIGTLLSVLSVVGALAVGLYFAGTPAGLRLLGLAELATKARERFVGATTVLWVALLGVSVLPMLFAEGALRPMRHAERPESRRVRTAAVGGLTLIVAVVYCGLFVFAASGVDLKVDYSYFKTSRPSDSTSKVAGSLPDSVRIVAFFPDVNEVKTEVENYLKELARNAPKLQFEIKDRLLEPKLANDLRVSRDGVVVFTKGKLNESLSFGTELAAAAPKLKTLDRDVQDKLMKLARAKRTTYMTVGHGELNDRPSIEEATVGRTARLAKELLRKQNYEVKDLGLSSGLAREVPADADIVMVLGPAEPLAPEEIATLKRYADAGGHLLLAIDPDVLAPTGPSFSDAPAPPTETPQAAHSAAPPASAKAHAAAPATAASGAPASPMEAPKTDAPAAGAVSGSREVELARTLKSLAAIADLELPPYLLANEQSYVRARFNDSDRVMLVSTKFSSHAAVSTLSRNAQRFPVVFGGAGSLVRPANDTSDETKIDFALKSQPDTFLDKNRNYRLDGDGEAGETHNIAAAVTRKPRSAAAKAPTPAASADAGAAADAGPAKDGETEEADAPKVPLPEDTRVFVLSDVDALGDLLMGNFPGNQLLLVDAVRWLGGEESFAGAVNSEDDVRIEHTKQKDLLWFYSTIFGAPALVLGVGLVISRRSRGRRRGNKS